MPPAADTPPPARRRFATTRWSVVIAAGRGAGDGRDAALAELCAAYWYPLYAYLRRRGHASEEAADLTQGLFAELLARDDLARLAPEGGRFRGWLLSALRHHVAHERERARAEKRGGGRTPVSFEAADAEARYALEPRDEGTPERLFERRWALTVIERSLSSLRAEYEARDRGALFEALKGGLEGERDPLPAAERAARLGMTGGALRVAAHRLRARYRELLEAEIADTLEEGADVLEELRAITAALSE